MKPSEDPPRPARRGRRASTDEHWKKVTVVLLDRQVAFLDRLTGDIRGASGHAIGRAHLIRALVDALAASDLDLTSIQSEADLTGSIRQRLAGSEGSGSQIVGGENPESALNRAADDQSRGGGGARRQD